MYQVQESKSKAELEEILKLRYTILREPWNQPASTATDELEAQSINAFVCDDNNNVIACGRLQENEGKVGQIRFMAVDNRFQGKGLGRLIVNYLEDKASELGLKTIELQARENAVDFYKNSGYNVKAKSFLLWGIIQHYLMEKKLNN
jgi:N-acetylglutamate synthase-like GNAT family acetyltransferase